LVTAEIPFQSKQKKLVKKNYLHHGCHESWSHSTNKLSVQEYVEQIWLDGTAIHTFTVILFEGGMQY
jgi:hypothetical protein